MPSRSVSLIQESFIYGLGFNSQTLNGTLELFLCNVKHNLCPQHISDLFTSKNTRFNLRNADISIPRLNTVNYGKHSLRCRGEKQCNIGIFKVKIKKISIDYLMTENCRALCSN